MVVLVCEKSFQTSFPHTHTHPSPLLHHLGAFHNFLQVGLELTPQKDKHPQNPQQLHFPLLLHMSLAGSPLPGVFLSGTPPPPALYTHCQVALPGCSFATTVPAPPKAEQHPASAPGHPGLPFLCHFCQELLPIPSFCSALPGNPPCSLPLTSAWQRSTARMALTLGCAPKRTADGIAAAESHSRSRSGFLGHTGRGLQGDLDFAFPLGNLPWLAKAWF